MKHLKSNKQVRCKKKFLMKKVEVQCQARSTMKNLLEWNRSVTGKAVKATKNTFFVKIKIKGKMWGYEQLSLQMITSPDLWKKGKMLQREMSTLSLINLI